MADRYDELYAATVANAQKQALAEIANEAQNVLKTADEQFKRGDSAGASWTLRSYAALKNEYDVIAGAPQQQQQQVQPQQPQQAQQQFTPAEMEWIRQNENVCRDPRKWAECVAAANSLAMRGYDRNSPEYLAAIELAIGLRSPDGRDGAEIASPDTALEAVNNSQIARKFGPVDADTYNRGVQRLIENKKLGLYEVDR
jgi:hypothetical protein